MGAIDDLIASPAPAKTSAMDELIAGPSQAPSTYHPGVFQTLLDQVQGEQLAGAQRTTPVTQDISGKPTYQPLGELAQDDTGQQGFSGPRNERGSSSWIPFDPKQHVILKDPQTGKMMIYARSDQTNTGQLAALGHVLLPGMASTAPEGLAVAAPRAVAATAPKVGGLAERTAALDAAGIDPSLSAASPNRGVGVTSKMVGDTVVGGPISSRTQTQFAQAGQRASDIAGDLSDVTEPVTAGERVQAATKKYFDTTARAQEDKLYDTARSFLGPKMGVEPTSTLPTARQAVTDLEGAIKDPSIRSFVTDSNFVELANTIKTAGETGASFDDLRQLRSQVRMLQPAAGTKTGINKVAVNKIYSALTSDMKNAADIFGGPQAVNAFEQADSYTRAVEAVHKPALEKILDATRGEDVFGKVQQWASQGSGADYRRLGQLKSAVDQQTWKDLSAAVIQKLGEPTAGAKAVPGAPEFSPASYMTNYAKLSDKAKSLLFDTATRSALDTLAKATGILKQAEKLGNPSGSGRFATSAAVVGGLLNPATTLLTLKALGGGFLASRILASPKIVRWMANAITAAKAGRVGTKSVLAKQIPFIINQGEQAAGPVLSSWLDKLMQESAATPGQLLSRPGTQEPAGSPTRQKVLQ